MTRLHRTRDDFEAEIRIFRNNEGGRRLPPFNGIRWDFAYAGDDIQETGLFMIHPDFMDDDGDSFPTDRPLQVDCTLRARMIVVSDEMREKVHRKRIAEGVRFYCHEGSRRVAEGIVTKITGLNHPR